VLTATTAVIITPSYVYDTIRCIACSNKHKIYYEGCQ
jgi:hypothetical protein